MGELNHDYTIDSLCCACYCPIADDFTIPFNRLFAESRNERQQISGIIVTLLPCIRRSQAITNRTIVKTANTNEIAVKMTAV